MCARYICKRQDYSVIDTADLFRIYPMVSVYFMAGKQVCYMPFGRLYPRESLTRSCGYRQLRYECSRPARSRVGVVSNDQSGAHRTHVEDLKDPAEVGLPTGNRLLVIPRVEKSGDCVASALFDDIALYFRDGPAIESML